MRGGSTTITSGWMPSSLPAWHDFLSRTRFKVHIRHAIQFRIFLSHHNRIIHDFHGIDFSSHHGQRPSSSSRYRNTHPRRSRRPSSPQRRWPVDRALRFARYSRGRTNALIFEREFEQFLSVHIFPNNTFVSRPMMTFSWLRLDVLTIDTTSGCAAVMSLDNRLRLWQHLCSRHKIIITCFVRKPRRTIICLRRPYCWPHHTPPLDTFLKYHAPPQSIGRFQGLEYGSLQSESSHASSS